MNDTMMMKFVNLIHPENDGTVKLNCFRCLEMTPPIYIRLRITFGFGASFKYCTGL